MSVDSRDPDERRPPSVFLQRVVLLIALTIHLLLLATQGLLNAPNLDETAHLPAGYSHWTFGNFALYRVNPPLIRLWAAVPLLLDVPQTDWTTFSNEPTSRAEFSVGAAFCAANGRRTFWYFTLARWMLLPVSVLGAWVCWRWAAELYGPEAGLCAAVMWCFCPNMLAWGASITPDAGAAAFGVLAAWRFWKWLQAPSWTNAGFAGLALGLAELTKSSWVLLFALWPVLWGIWRWARVAAPSPAAPFRQLCLILLSALYLLNLGYGFEGTGQRLQDFHFLSQTLGGPDAHAEGGNRFRETWAENVRVPLPANYLRGIDLQKYDFERGKWSWLRGEQKLGGWWYYYIFAMLVKTPLGFLMLFAIATGLFAFRRRFRGHWPDELLLIAPGLAIVVLVSSQTGFNRYLRYVLPAYPFAFVFAARTAIAFRERSRLLRAVVVLLLAGGVVSSLAVFPHSLSYFNVAAGGPAGGRNHLLDGNLDWGQDLLRFRDWVRQHPEARPLYSAVTTLVPLDSAGIDSESVPSAAADDSQPLPPGWYAISVNHLLGYKLHGNDRPECIRFQKMESVDRIGHTIDIFHVTAESRSDERTTTR